MTIQEILNSHYYTRIGVAVNPNTPTNILNELAKDSSSDVRWAVTKTLNFR